MNVLQVPVEFETCQTWEEAEGGGRREEVREAIGLIEGLVQSKMLQIRSKTQENGVKFVSPSHIHGIIQKLKFAFRRGMSIVDKIDHGHAFFLCIAESRLFYAKTVEWMQGGDGGDSIEKVGVDEYHPHELGEVLAIK